MFIQSDETVIWRHIRQARIDLVSYLETLTEEQWNEYSLCDGWKNRDVLAHLILEYSYTPSNSWKDFLRSGLRINRFMKRTAIDLGRAPSSELVVRFRDMVDDKHKPSSVSVMNVLVDLLIHEQDIHIPFNQAKRIDAKLLRLVYDHWEPTKYNFGEKITGLARRLKGLQFIVTDLGITKGSGDVVEGTAQDILLSVVGRTVTIDKLHGDGQTILKHRLQ